MKTKSLCIIKKHKIIVQLERIMPAGENNRRVAILIYKILENKFLIENQTENEEKNRKDYLSFKENMMKTVIGINEDELTELENSFVENGWLTKELSNALSSNVQQKIDDFSVDEGDFSAENKEKDRANACTRLVEDILKEIQKNKEFAFDDETLKEIKKCMKSPSMSVLSSDKIEKAIEDEIAAAFVKGASDIDKFISNTIAELSQSEVDRQFHTWAKSFDSLATAIIGIELSTNIPDDVKLKVIKDELMKFSKSNDIEMAVKDDIDGIKNFRDVSAATKAVHNACHLSFQKKFKDEKERQDKQNQENKTKEEQNEVSIPSFNEKINQALKDAGKINVSEENSNLLKIESLRTVFKELLDVCINSAENLSDLMGGPGFLAKYSTNPEALEKQLTKNKTIQSLVERSVFDHVDGIIADKKEITGEDIEELISQIKNFNQARQKCNQAGFGQLYFQNNREALKISVKGLAAVAFVGTAVSIFDSMDKKKFTDYLLSKAQDNFKALSVGAISATVTASVTQGLSKGIDNYWQSLKKRIGLGNIEEKAVSTIHAAAATVNPPDEEKKSHRELLDEIGLFGKNKEKGTVKKEEEEEEEEENKNKLG